MLVAVQAVGNEECYRPPLESAGYVLRVREPGHRMFRTLAKDVHVHLWDSAAEIERHLRFRDRLVGNEADRQLYERTKRELAKRAWPDREAYASAKDEVIAGIMKRANAEKSMRRFSIRTANEADLETVARLHYDVREASLPYLPRIRTLQEVLRSFPAALRACDVLVAERDGAIVGYCAFRPGWLEHLYVDAAHQREGIGAALLERALRAMQSCKLWVFQKNRAAIRLYERYGFRLVRTTEGENEEREPDALYEKRA